MTRKITRRAMLKTSTVVGAGALFLSRNILARGQSPNETLNVALIGLGNQGGHQIGGMERNKQNVVALCDVDRRMVVKSKAVEKFPKAKLYVDFREMYDEMSTKIDAVCISTPDHMHYHPAIRAIREKKHVYLEKPMAHSVAECRIITDEAAKNGVATQLGCQRHTIPNMARVVEIIKSGAIGDVTEVHTWIGGDRGMWPMPDKFVEPPTELNWPLWLGPAADRPYALSVVNGKADEPTYAPYNWRFWWDFGTGETGNWACHNLDIPYWALDLKYPVKVAATGPEVDPERTPKEMHCTFVYPKRGELPGLTLYWSHTKNPPCKAKYKLPNEFANGMKFGHANNFFVGTKGMLLTGYDRHVLLPEDTFADFTPPEQTCTVQRDFHKDWIRACKGGKAAMCDFAYSGPMAETAILGNTAFRVGHKSFDWDSGKMVAADCPEVQAALKPEFKKGWEY